MRNVFDLSLQTGVFPNPLKIAKVTSVFQIDHFKEIRNYRPISFLPCFSEMLERMMHNHLYSYLGNEKISYLKLVGFQNGHSTENVIVQLADQIHLPFENEN